MADFTFDSERECPKCKAKFGKAPLQSQYDPVIVVTCPGCKDILWRPGLEPDSPLFPYDPNADSEGF